MQIVTQAPDMMHIVGDIMMRNAPFPGAEQIADRLHNMVPPQALGGPSPAEQQAAAEIQKLNGQISKLMQDLVARKNELDNADAKHRIEEYRAETDRMGAIKDIDPEALVPIVRQMVREAMGMSLPQLQAMHGIQPAPQTPPDQPAQPAQQGTT